MQNDLAMTLLPRGANIRDKVHMPPPQCEYMSVAEMGGYLIFERVRYKQKVPMHYNGGT